MARLRLRRIGYALGAEITGLDLSRPLEADVFAEVRQAWLDHMLLRFPDQVLDKRQFVAFARQFSDEIDEHGDAKTGDPENRNILLVTNRPVAGKAWDGYKNGQSWHSDRSYTDRPSVGAFLLAKELPEAGGDTLFANQYMAYEALSPKMREIAESLSAVHDGGKIKNFDQQASSIVQAHREEFPPIVHPVVVTHPETGRKALYIGERLRQLADLTLDESKPLLDFLNQHAVRYEFCYRHRWTVNDLVMWDNRCLLHLAVSDYDQSTQPRHLWRCSYRGARMGQQETVLAGSIGS